ncbi:hypothetical protein LCGC14_1707510, partial [marine sediment metagenome]
MTKGPLPAGGDAAWYDRPMRWAQLTLVANDPGRYDPDFWLDFIEKATEYRIVVVIVTARPKDQIEDIVAAVPWN